MTGPVIEDRDHIARHCSFSRLREDGSPTGAAFRPLTHNLAAKLPLYCRIMPLLALCASKDWRGARS